MSTNEPISIDSLPYYDRDLDLIPNLRQRVEREIEQEIKQSSSSKTPQTHHSFLDRFPDLSSTKSNQPKEIYHELLHQSFPSLSNSQPETEPETETKGLDLERLNIPYPTDPNDLNSWNASLKNAKSQIEQQRIRLLNLKLMNQYGSNHWRLNNFLIEKEIHKLENQLGLELNKIDQINRRRKINQMEVGERLNDLSQKWQDLISSNISLEIMNLNLTQELEFMRSQEKELKSKLNQ